MLCVSHSHSTLVTTPDICAGCSHCLQLMHTLLKHADAAVVHPLCIRQPLQLPAMSSLLLSLAAWLPCTVQIADDFLMVLLSAGRQLPSHRRSSELSSAALSSSCASLSAVWAKRTSTAMVKDTEAAVKEMDEATKSLCNTACVSVHDVSQASGNNARFLANGFGALRVM